MSELIEPMTWVDSPLSFYGKALTEEDIQIFKQWVKLCGSVKYVYPSKEDIYDLIRQLPHCEPVHTTPLGPSIWDAIKTSKGLDIELWWDLWKQIPESLWSKITASIKQAVWGDVWMARNDESDFIHDSIDYSVKGLIGYLLALMVHERRGGAQKQFYSVRLNDLWNDGFVPVFDGEKWRLCGNLYIDNARYEKATIMYEFPDIKYARRWKALYETIAW